MKRHFLLLAILLLSLFPALPAHGAEPAAASPWPLTMKWQRCPNWYCETGWYASPAVGDLDADGAAEVFWGGYTLMAVNGTSGTIKWIRPQGSSARLWPGIVLADINNDTHLEVVTASGDGELAVYGPGLNPISPWPKNPTGDGREIRSLATADMDNDHDLEIAICSTRSDNQWFVYEHDGTVRSGWPQFSPDGDTNGYASGCFNENVAVADVDGDGSAEVIGPNDTHYVAAFHADGSPLRANPVYGLINGVRKAWARVGLHVDNAVDLRGYADCGVEHRPNMANSAPTIADVNGDGKLEIILVGNVYNCGADPYEDLYEMPFIFNADRTRWKDATHDWTVIPTPDAHAAPLSEDYNVIENNAPNPVVADLDGDGLREILYPSYDGRVHAYWLDKTEHGSWPFEVTDANEGFIRFATEPIVVDLDNNGKAEVIFGSWTQNDSNKPGKLYVVSWDGKLIDAVELPFNASDGRGGALGAPTIANIDADPDLELVLGTINRGLVAYDIGNSANARILWGTGRGNYLRAGVAPTQVKGTLATSQKLVDKAQAEPNDPLHYTIRLLNPGALLPSARLTDTLPTNATLVTGTVHASSGQVAIAGGRILWAGEVSSTQPVTVTYTLLAGGTPGEASVIRNTALIDNDQGTVITRTAVTILGGEAVYLPKIENR